MNIVNVSRSCTILLFLSPLVFGQNKAAAKEDVSRSTATSAEMKKLQFLLGKWQGDGVVYLTKGQIPAKISETYQSKFNGTIITMEGSDNVTVAPALSGSYGVISYDGANHNYPFRLYLPDGRWIDGTGQLNGQSFVWGYGNVRTTLKVDGGKLSAVSEFSSGGSWQKFQDVTLSKAR